MNDMEAYIQIYYWQYSNTGSFHNKLFDLICKADCDNRELLRRAFPAEVRVWEEWQNHPEPDDFFQAIRLNIEEAKCQI